jgi:hypothetical protein
MLVTGNDVLSYQGNAALGLNSDGIEDYGDTDLRELNNTVFNTQYLNMQKNRGMYEQKIKDRDDAMALIRDGRLKVDQALPQDREKLRGMIEEMKDVWKKNGGDLKSDPNVWLDFNDKLGKFKDQQTNAATRYVVYHNGIADAAREKNPIRKNKMMQYWDSQLSRPIEEIFDPYQQTLDWDASVVLPDLPALSTKKRDEFNDVTTTVTDVNSAFRNYVTKYEFDDKQETAPNVDAFYDNFFGIDGLKDLTSVGQSVNSVNNRLRKIATDMGFNPDDKDSLPVYLKPLEMVSNDPTTGKPGTADTKQVAAFKVALAYKYQNVSTSAFNKDYAALAKTTAEISKLKAEQDATKALAAQRRSYIPYNQARANYWNKKGTETENANNVQNIFNDVVARAKTYEFQEGKQDVVWVGDLPKGFTQVLSGVDKKGEPIQLKPLKRSNGAEYFKVGKSSFFVSANGSRYSDAEIKKAYDQQSQFSNYQDFLDNLVEKGYKQDVELIGSNGRGTAQSTIQALRALNNKNNSQKTDEVLFDNSDNQE